MGKFPFVFVSKQRAWPDVNKKSVGVQECNVVQGVSKLHSYIVSQPHSRMRYNQQLLGITVLSTLD